MKMLQEENNEVKYLLLDNQTNYNKKKFRKFFNQLFLFLLYILFDQYQKEIRIEQLINKLTYLYEVYYEQLLDHHQYPYDV
jgi:hypothetical protein